MHALDWIVPCLWLDIFHRAYVATFIDTHVPGKLTHATPVLALEPFFKMEPDCWKDSSFPLYLMNNRRHSGEKEDFGAIVALDPPGPCFDFFR